MGISFWIGRRPPLNRPRRGEGIVMPLNRQDLAILAGFNAGDGIFDQKWGLVQIIGGIILFPALYIFYR
ncbi:hypothetical protein [Sodalis sp. RH20]|uniref:hypothetical protein n=1 Tax=unclassified Sodalis (in: enterobacteria) TaxID=2636512 RepID=UPI0039B55B8F